MRRGSYSSSPIQATPAVGARSYPAPTAARSYPAPTVKRAGSQLSQAPSLPPSVVGGGASALYSQYKGAGGYSPYSGDSSPRDNSLGTNSSLLGQFGQVAQRPSGYLGQSPSLQRSGSGSYLHGGTTAYNAYSSPYGGRGQQSPIRPVGSAVSAAAYPSGSSNAYQNAYSTPGAANRTVGQVGSTTSPLSPMSPYTPGQGPRVISPSSIQQPTGLAKPSASRQGSSAPTAVGRKEAKVLGTTYLDGTPVDPRAAKSIPKALDLKTGAIRKDQVPSTLRPTVDRMTRLLRDREELKKHVVSCFAETNRNVNKAADADLDMGTLRMFRSSLARALQVSPDEAFRNMEMDFERFDFSGKGALSINSAYRLVKFHLLEYRKRLGATPATSDVPNNTPQGAGYQIIKELGKGSQGTAMLAYDSRGQECCVKSFDKMEMDAEAASQLLMEFENLKLLQCEGIAGALEMFQDPRNYYIVGDVYTGGDFCTFKERSLAQGVTMTEDWVKGTWKQVLDAIAFMHQQALIHCDLKEPNLMLKTTDYQNPQVVIIDLGVAVSLAQKDKDSPAGTPGYVPPEVLETFKWFPRGDLFSIGVTIMQVMTDKIPNGTLGPGSGGIFVENCNSIPEVFQATKNRVPPFHLVPPQYSGLTALLKKLLEKDRKKRPTALDALNDPWFTAVAQGEQTWAASDARQMLKPKNKIATVGITKSFIQRVENESFA